MLKNIQRQQNWGEGKEWGEESSEDEGKAAQMTF